jgi:hypothetical protein
MEAAGFGEMDPGCVDPPPLIPDAAWTLILALTAAQADMAQRVASGERTHEANVGVGYFIKTGAGRLRVGDFTQGGLSAVGGIERAGRELTENLRLTQAVEYVVYVPPEDWSAEEPEITIARYQRNSGSTFKYKVADLLNGDVCAVAPASIGLAMEGWYGSLLDDEPADAFEREVGKAHEENIGADWERLVEMCRQRVEAVCSEDLHSLVVDGNWKDKPGAYEVRFGSVPMKDPTRPEFAAMANLLKCAGPKAAILVLNFTKIERDAGVGDEGVMQKFQVVVMQPGRKPKAGMFQALDYGPGKTIVTMVGSRDGSLWWWDVERSLGWFLDLAVQEGDGRGGQMRGGGLASQQLVVERELKRLGMSWGGVVQGAEAT